MAGKAAGAQGREATLVREAGQRVGLVHELRQLGGAVELLDGRHDRTDVDQRLRRDVIGVLRGHALAHDSLHTAHANTELVLDKLAHGAHATVAKVVNVVGVLGLITGVEGQEVAESRHNVLAGDHALVGIDIKAELLVDLVAANASQVVALRVEVEAVEQRACGVDGGRLAGALTAVDLEKGVLARGRNVALDGRADNVGVAEEREDFVVGLGDAKGTQERRRALATLAVDGDHKVAALVDLELKPCAARGNELNAVDENARVHLGGKVHARRADQLGDHDALGAVDDEGAAIGHEREVAHEDELLLDLASLLVNETHIHEEGGLVGEVLGAAFGQTVGRVTKLVLAKGHLHGPGRVLNGRELREGLGDAVGHEVLERVLLDGDEVGQLHRRGDFAKALARSGDLRFSKRSLCGRHQAFPPSKGWKAAIVAN